MFFNHYINVWVFHGIRSFRVETWTWRNWKIPTKRLFFYVVVSQGNSGNKVENGNFLILKSNNCVEFSVFNVFS